MEDLRSNITLLDGDNQSFSPIANRMLANGTVSPKWIAHWVYSQPKIHNVIKGAAKTSTDLGIDYNATDLILDDAMLITSLEQLGYSYEDALTAHTQAGHALILDSAPELRPELLASSDTITRYCHSLTTTISIVHPRDEWQRFLKEAPAFIAWAKDHDEITVLIEAATKARSLNRAAIESLMPMISSTQSALRTGLL